MICKINYNYNRNYKRYRDLQKENILRLWTKNKSAISAPIKKGKKNYRL